MTDITINLFPKREHKENNLQIKYLQKLTFWRLALVSWSSLHLGPLDAMILL